VQKEINMTISNISDDQIVEELKELTHQKPLMKVKVMAAEILNGLIKLAKRIMQSAFNPE
jgi:hypothetical protein